MSREAPANADTISDEEIECGAVEFNIAPEEATVVDVDEVADVLWGGATRSSRIVQKLRLALSMHMTIQRSS